MPKALVNMQLDNSAGDLRDIVNDVAQIEHVTWAYLTFGPIDAVAYVSTPSWIKLTQAVLQINAVNGVASTDTRIVVPDEE